MSLRARLLLATAAIALVALVGADVATYAALRSFLYGQIDNSLELSHKSVEASISHGPTPSGSAVVPPPQGCATLDGQEVNTQGLNPGTFIEVRTKSGRTVYRCSTSEYGTTLHDVPVLPAHITGLSVHNGAPSEPTVFFTAAGTDSAGAFRVRASTLDGGPLDHGTLIVAVPLVNTSNTLGTLVQLELIVTGAALVVALGLGWSLVRASLRPLRDVERTAAAIADGQLTERVPGDGTRTEVGRVAHALNVMLGRIEDAFAERDRTESQLRESEERMRRFVADASHELRTPLAAVRAYAELFDRGAADRPDDLRRVIHGIQSESGRMGHLVEDLLLLAHLDEGRALEVDPVELVALAADAVTTARALGPEWPVSLVATEPVEVRADALRLRQVLDNLLGNVRVHTPPGTAATVTISRDGEFAEIAVADEGPGLSAEDAERIWERFFRADPSRTRHRGGAGLGLAIVSAIVRAHGGTVGVSPAPGGGARFVVRLPRRGPPAAAAAPADTF